MIDANQKWDVDEAVSWVSRLAEFKPLWIEEPTSPDDILGHATISKVRQKNHAHKQQTKTTSVLLDILLNFFLGFGSTRDWRGNGRTGQALRYRFSETHSQTETITSPFSLKCHNRVMFKQLLQASALQFVQIDSCRLGSVNENLAVMLMAHKFKGERQEVTWK